LGVPRQSRGFTDCNYTGLICKAADAGYKFIIVLAGIHDNLRAQTQIRLEEGFLGYTTEKEKNYESIGVGVINPDHKPNLYTSRYEDGDYGNRSHLQHYRHGQELHIAVIKKNARVLDRLLPQLDNNRDCPLLVIDDEADHASIDTAGPDSAPKRINGLIRKLLHSSKNPDGHIAYVGYTATPFANIFIDDQNVDKVFGENLFPKDFIVTLPVPDNHVGPERIFGTGETGIGLPEEAKKSKELPELPLCRYVDSDEAKKWLPSPDESPKGDLPKSLKEAILSFFIVCAVRACRGDGKKHSSMLIHVTRNIGPQKKIAKKIKDYLEAEKRGVDEKKFRFLWEKEKNGFLAVHSQISPLSDFGIPDEMPKFDDMMKELRDVVQHIEVREINGSAEDMLDYEEHKENGLKVIVVGGDKLSRGLTLEGLSISYFLRTSKMYDTLMQMGRWFGYRQGYLDLCRLYVTRGLAVAYRQVCNAFAELREEFENAVRQRKTPREYGHRVLVHPSLLVTSPLKMRNGTKIQISYAETYTETLTFHSDYKILLNNFRKTEKFLENLERPHESGNIKRGGRTWNGHLWNDIEAGEIIGYFRNYQSHEAAPRANTRMLAKYVEAMSKLEELTSWTVALIGIQKGDTAEIANHVVNMPNRTVEMIGLGNNSRYSLKALSSPEDELIDLTPEELKNAPKLTKGNPSRKNIQKHRHPSRGLLLLYLLNPKNFNGDMRKVPAVVGLTVSFPHSEQEQPCVKYVVNNKYLELD
jgi:hypothetical protein